MSLCSENGILGYTNEEIAINNSPTSVMSDEKFADVMKWVFESHGIFTATGKIQQFRQSIEQAAYERAAKYIELVFDKPTMANEIRALKTPSSEAQDD